MSPYRLFLYDSTGSIIGRDDVAAEDDRSAMVVAELLCEACSDACDSFELWDGMRRVDASFSKLPRPSVSASQITERMQASLMQSEEAIRNSEWRVAHSRRLLERLQRLAELRKPVVQGRN